METKWFNLGNFEKSNLNEQKITRCVKCDNLLLDSEIDYCSICVCERVVKLINKEGQK